MSNFIIKEIPEYIKKDFHTEFLPCPRCGSEYVVWSNNRDLDILNQEVYCYSCELTTFHVETMALFVLENLDYETTLMKYNAWVKTNPKFYWEDSWE